MKIDWSTFEKICERYGAEIVSGNGQIMFKNDDGSVVPLDESVMRRELSASLPAEIIEYSDRANIIQSINDMFEATTEDWLAA